MHRIAKILLIGGLLLLLCGPALVAAQTNGPEKDIPCTSASPVINGRVEALWEQYAHWEDITVDPEVIDLQNGHAYPYGVDLAMMRNQDILYILVTEYWEVADLQPTQLEGLYSVFCMGIEDQPPSWEWNVKNPENDSDEGWFCFVGGEGFDVDGVRAQDWEGLESAAFFIGRVGGNQASLLDCFDGLWMDFEGMPPSAPHLSGVEHAFGVYYELDGQALQSLMWVHEVAIDLSASPLNPIPEDRFRAWFAALGLGPSEIGPAGLKSAEDFRALAQTIGQPLPEDFVIGLWPGGRGMVNPADPPEQQAEDMLMFAACCLETGEFEGSCNWCIPCFGRIDLTPCEVIAEEEFVPEPGTLLLLGSGLMGLGGYASLCFRKR